MFGSFFTTYARKTYQNGIITKENVLNNAKMFVVNFKFTVQKKKTFWKIHFMEASEDC